jgi:hypothetical protein
MSLEDKIKTAENSGILDVSNMNLYTLPELPSNLIKLRCTDNYLTFLPPLPSSLKALFCYNNKIRCLPKLPDSLITLYCNHNKLVNMPEFPPFLTSLVCTFNNIEKMPELPNTLVDLYCGNNKLTTLPELPNSLINLGITGNMWNPIFNNFMTSEKPIQKINEYYNHKKQRKALLKGTLSFHHALNIDDEYTLLNNDILSVVTSYISGEEGYIPEQICTLKQKCVL